MLKYMVAMTLSLFCSALAYCDPNAGCNAGYDEKSVVLIKTIEKQLCELLGQDCQAEYQTGEIFTFLGVEWSLGNIVRCGVACFIAFMFLEWRDARKKNQERSSSGDLKK